MQTNVGIGRVASALLLGIVSCGSATAKPATIVGSQMAQPGDELTIDARIVDAAGILSSATRRLLAAKLEAYEALTKRQLFVVTTPSLRGAAVQDYGARLFGRAGLWPKGQHDKIGLLIAPAERQTNIQVGPALADELTDIRKEQIASRVTTVHLRRGDAEGATVAAVNSIIATLECVDQGACALTEFAIAVGEPN